MYRTVILIVILILITNGSFAASMEIIEEHFQKGLAYSHQDMLDESIEEFATIVATDPKDLESNYYEQTYTESYMNIGLLKSKQEQWQESIHYYKEALKILPDHKKTLYYLSYSYFAVDEIAEALKHYNRAVYLGFLDELSKEDFVGEALKPFQKREVEYVYKSFFNPEEELIIPFKGNSAGDDALLYDVFTAMEKLRKAESQAMFTNVIVEFIRRWDNGEVFLEKWEVYENKNVTEYWVTYDLTPPEGFPDNISIHISKEEPK